MNNKEKIEIERALNFADKTKFEILVYLFKMIEIYAIPSLDPKNYENLIKIKEILLERYKL